MRFLEHFFGTVGKLKTFAAMIPGPGDVPLRTFCHASVYAESEIPTLHVVHGRLALDRDVVISGIGGELTATEDTGEGPS